MRGSLPRDAFSPTYADARARFLEAARDAGLAVESHVHPLSGPDGGEIAMDVARDGATDAAGVLVLSSACHGPEGHCGSGVQVTALRDRAWRDHAAHHGIAVVYVHGLNPYGFAHTSRATHENVDLNRNFHDFSQPLPVNAGYREVHDLLLPAQWPPTPQNEAAIAALVAQRGVAAYQAAVSAGQYEFEDGLFFGGTSPTWSNATIRGVLRKHARHARRLAWIDFHTGLGPSGLGERIYAGPDDATTIERARSWWDGGGATPVTSIYDGSSASARVCGMLWNAARDECPQAELTSIALEYGTVPILESIEALRGDHWLRLHPEAPQELAASIKRRMLDAFYTDTDEWKERVVEQGRDAMVQAVAGLARR